MFLKKQLHRSKWRNLSIPQGMGRVREDTETWVSAAFGIMQTISYGKESNKSRKGSSDCKTATTDTSNENEPSLEVV